MKEYDLAVIGAGPGGMTAALYGARANLKVAMIDRGVYGGQMNNTAEVENYTGFKSILGPDLAEQMYQSAIQFGADFVYGNVEKVTVDEDGIKHVKTDSGELEAPAIVIATGSQYRKLGIPGEDEYSGKGVSYCAVCDGAFYRGKDVTTVGGGDSAVEESEYLAKLVNNVNIVHRRDQLRAQKILQDRAFANDKINFTWNTIVTEIVGDGKKVTGVKTHNKETNEDRLVPTDGVFIYIGNVPMTEPFKDLGITDEQGWVITNDEMKTSVPGVFAVGDVRDKKLRQITTAVGDGGIAGQGVFSYIESLKD